MTELLEALYRGDDDKVSELLAAEPELNAFEAAAFGRSDRLRELLERGADPNTLARNEHIKAGALHSAVASEDKPAETRYELARLLLDNGADPNLRQGDGFSALDAARQNGDERLERLLLDRGAGA